VSRREEVVEAVAGTEFRVVAEATSFKADLAGQRVRMVVLGMGKIIGTMSSMTVYSGQAKGTHMIKEGTGIRGFSGTMLRTPVW
jgi:hypothetical protein